MRRFEWFLVGLVTLALLLIVPPAQAEEEGEGVTFFPMNDLRATVHLPDKWEVHPGSWSDQGIRCKSDKGDIDMRLWFTPFQVAASEDAAQAWVKMHTARLGKHKAENIETKRVELVEHNGRPMIEIDLSFQFEGGTVQGLYQALAFEDYGKVIHMALMSNDRNLAKAIQAKQHFLETTEWSKQPEDLSELWGKGVSPERFEASLPDGWRVFAKSEMGPVAELVKKTGQDRYDKDKCFAAIRPVGGDVEPDFMIFCQGGLLLDKVDEYSWDGIEPTVREKFFGGSSVEVEAAEKVVIGDRLGFLYHPPARGSETLMAVAPYETGNVMVGWARAGEKDGLVDDAFRSTLSKMRFTGPNGGEQPMGGIGGWFIYSIRYRPFNPLFIGPVVLVLVGFLALIVILARHKPKELEDY
jgi:hypothetical protein